MDQRIYDIFLSLPVFVQNTLVSIYGYKILKERYSKHAIELNKLLEETQKFSLEEMRLYQENAFVKIARDAIKYVPFYRDWAQANGIKEEEISKISDLDLFPILNREEVVGKPEYFVSDRFRKDKLIRLSTSGSSGKPVTIYTDKKSRTFHYCFFTRLRKWYGITQGSKRTTLFGRVIVPINQNRPPFWRYDATQKNLLMSTFHLSNKNTPYYYEKINNFKPDEIFGYTSSIYEIARYIVEAGKAKIPAKLILCTAETLMPYQRDVIESAFDAPVVDQYGCTEMAFFAAQSTSGTMMFHPEHAICEVVDSEFEPCGVDQAGELLATGLVNEVMPLIRYRVGDRVALSSRTDIELPGFPVISKIEGRMDDLIYTKDGRTIGRLSPIFRSDKEISASQVIQNKDGDVLIKVVPTKNYTEYHKKKIYNDSLQRIGDSVTISVIEVENIERERNGKIKPVKSFFEKSD